MFVLDQVHFVNEAEDKGCGAELFQSFDDGAVGVEVPLDFTGLDVEDVDEDSYVGEDCLTLGGQVGFSKGILAAGVLAIGKGIKRIEVYACPPQSHRLRVRLPMNFAWLCSTSMVAPRRRTSFAT